MTRRGIALASDLTLPLEAVIGNACY